MKKFDKIIGKLSLVAVLLFALFVLMSGDAFASGTTAGTQSHYGACREKGNIFAVMRCMIAYTLYDIRYIVYIVGALGLITFAYGAIFGKISFKHLANICFSLFLVSMLSPFVRYFSGDENALPELTYNLYLSPDYDETDDCSDIDIEGLVATTGLRHKAAEEAGGGEEAEEKTMSTWDKIKKTIGTVREETQKAVNTASSVYSAAKNTAAAVRNSVNSVKSIHDLQSALAAGQVIFDNADGISANIVMAAGAIGSNYIDPKVMAQYDAQIAQIEEGIAADQAQIADNFKYLESLELDMIKLETAMARLKESKRDYSAIEAQIEALKETRKQVKAETEMLRKEVDEWRDKIAYMEEDKKSYTAAAKTANALSGVNSVISEGQSVGADVSQTAGAVQGGLNMGGAILKGEGLW